MSEQDWMKSKAKFDRARDKFREAMPILKVAIVAEILGAFTWMPLFYAGGIVAIALLAYSGYWLGVMGRSLREMEKVIK